MNEPKASPGVPDAASQSVRTKRERVRAGIRAETGKRSAPVEA